MLIRTCLRLFKRVKLLGFDISLRYRLDDVKTYAILDPIVKS